MLDRTFKPKNRALDFTHLEVFPEKDLLSFALVELKLEPSISLEDAYHVAWKRYYSAGDNPKDGPPAFPKDGSLPFVIRCAALEYVKKHPSVL